MNGTMIHYYFVCKRKLWLFAHKIEQEHNSDLVAIGKLIDENSFQRNVKQLQNEELAIDRFDQVSKTIYEIKKSEAMEESHEWQVKYYLYCLARMGVQNIKGVLKYPKLKQQKVIQLSELEQKSMQELILEIEEYLNLDTPPVPEKSSICKSCAYYDYCYVE